MMITGLRANQICMFVIVPKSYYFFIDYIEGPVSQLVPPLRRQNSNHQNNNRNNQQCNTNYNNNKNNNQRTEIVIVKQTIEDKVGFVIKTTIAGHLRP